MPKYNEEPSVSTEVVDRPDATVNREGGLAYGLDAKTDLTLRIVTWLVGEPKYYGAKEDDDGNQVDEDKEIDGLIAKIAEDDPEYLLRLAAYARNEMYLRSAPLWLLVEAAKYQSAKPYLRVYTPLIIRRADELTEALALFIKKNGEIGKAGKASLPNQLKLGIADAFERFSEYDLAKYDRDGKVKIRDVLRLVHPKPRNDEQSVLYKRVKDRTLTIPETWETVVSGKGSTKEAWESILPKMGYMALLRNLRNLLKVDVEPEQIARRLIDPEAVKNSKQFPYRFYSAMKALEEGDEGNPFHRGILVQAVAKAFELSIQNVPHWSGRTVVATDNSGSMDDTLSEKSKIKRIEVGNVMGALAYRISDAAIAMCFGEGLAVASPPMGVPSLVLAKTLVDTDVGHSTNAYLVIQYLREKKLSVDRILVFSDLQCYGPGNWDGDGSHSKNSLAAQYKLYKREVNPKTRLYSFDLAGYGTSQFPKDEPNVCLLGGFSDRVFQFIKTYEEGLGDMVQAIESYSPVKPVDNGDVAD